MVEEALGQVIRIAVDVDGVIAEQVPPVLERVRSQYGVRMTKRDIRAWDQPIPGTKSNIKLEIERALLDPEYVRSMRPVRGAAAALHRLHELGLGIVIVTHRPRESDAPTRQWMQEYGIAHDAYVNSSQGSKASVEADVLVDDYPNNVEEFVRQGRKAILFRQPWNAGFAQTAASRGSNLWVARSWSEVEAALKKMGLLGGAPARQAPP